MSHVEELHVVQKYLTSASSLKMFWLVQKVRKEDSAKKFKEEFKLSVLSLPILSLPIFSE